MALGAQHQNSGFFGLEIDKLDVGFFMGCSGLSIEFETADQASVDSKAKTRVITKAPGSGAKYADIVLKRGYTVSTTLSDWFDEVVEGGDDIPFKTGSIVLYDHNMKERSRFNFEQMWPSKLSLGDLDAMNGKELMVEELTIKHERLDWV